MYVNNSNSLNFILSKFYKYEGIDLKVKKNICLINYGPSGIEAHSSLIRFKKKILLNSLSENWFSLDYSLLKKVIIIIKISSIKL